MGALSLREGEEGGGGGGGGGGGEDVIASCIGRFSLIDEMEKRWFSH